MAFKFQHDLTYAGFKNLPRKTTSDKAIRSESFNFAKCPKSDGYQYRLPSIVYMFFNKKASGGAVTRADKSAIKSKIITNQQLTKYLHKPIIRKSEKCRVCSSFKDNISVADLADAQLISKYNKEICFLYVLPCLSFKR